MTKIAKYIILIFLLALQVVYLIEIIERVSLNKWSDIFFPCIFSLFIWNVKENKYQLLCDDCRLFYV